MKFVPIQCKQCPFRKTSAPGWLGDYDAGTVFSSIWKGFPFYCHTTIDYRKKNWAANAEKNGKLCTGGLAFANLIGAPEREVQHPAILIAREKVKLVPGIECMTPQEFIEHHPDWKSR
jgi:hypothetical protein